LAAVLASYDRSRESSDDDRETMGRFRQCPPWAYASDAVRYTASSTWPISGVSIAATGVAFGRGPRFAIAAAVLAAIALIVLVVQLSFELDASARAHADSSAQLWALRERYRALLSDLHDGALTVAEARARRDKLLDELRAIYDTTPIIALEEAPSDSGSPANNFAFSPKDVTTEVQSVR